MDDGYFEVDYKTGAPVVTEFMKTRALAAFLIRLLAHSRNLAVSPRLTIEEYSKILES